MTNTITLENAKKLKKASEKIAKLVSLWGKCISVSWGLLKPAVED